MAQTGAHGGMDIEPQKATFHHFLSATVWLGGQLVQGVALLTLAFAIGDGWWMGFLAFVGIGIAIGIFFKMSGAYWAVQVAEWVLLGIGGLVIPALAGMMG